MKKSIDIMPDTIILYTGYYTSDIEKLCGRNTGAAPAILTGPSFRVYIGISPGESLKLRRERKRKHESDDDILSIDKEVYFPTFRRYVSTYDPAAWADVVFKLVSVEGETRLMEVTPHTKSWQEIDVEHYNPPAVKNVTIFGAGAMGRGLFGLLFRKWGHNVTFIDTDADIVARLDKDKMYKVMIKGAESTSPNNYYLVDKVEALLSSREEGNIRRIEKVIRDSDAICLSLPDTKLEETCQLLGKCLENRRLCGNENFLNIFLTTNKRNAAKDVKRMILSGVAEAYRATLEKYIDTYVGIIETTVLGGVRRGTEEEMRKSPTTVYIGGDNKLIADATAFKGECPEFMMQRKRNIEAEKTRRLALFSCQHATVGYLGYIAGHKDVYSAWANPWIRYEVTKLSRMLSRALVEKYGFFEIEQEEYIEWIEKIFSNRNFGDTIPGRITRDPLRRLGPDERFATSKYLLSSRRDTEEAEGSIALAIAACLCYDNKNDAQAVELQERLRRETIEVVLNNLCGIDPKSPLGKKVIKKYIQLRRFYAACSDFDTLAPKTFKEPTHVFIDFDNIIVNIKDIYRESFKKLYISIKKGGTNTIATEEAALESEAERCFDNIEDLNNMLPVFSDLIRLAVACGIPEESLKRAEEYLAEYGKEVKDKISGRIKDGKGDSLLKPSAQEFLIELQNHGKHVYFFTGLDLKFVTEHIIPHLNLQNYFRVIYKINGDNTVLGESLRLLMRSEGLERNRVVFLSSSPQTIGKVRSLTGDEITIVAVKENPQSEAAYPGANYLFGELKPTKSKLTLFTDGKLIPKAVSMPDERKTETQRTPENDIRWIIGQGRALESIDSAA
jgi:mannitol-1-phosphate 5-dehydrogenase